MPQPKLLIVDDDESIRTQMKWALTEEYDVFLAGDSGRVMQIVKDERPAIVTLDLGLPPDPEGTEEGFRLLNQLLQYNTAIKVIVVTGNPDKSSAMKAIGQGAYDFFTKPVDIDDLKAILKRAAYVHTLEVEYRNLRKQMMSQAVDEVIGVSPKMQEVFSLISKVTTIDMPVLITGESGTGKELIARAIHNKSVRKAGPFIPINCGAIPEQLMESELFGHEKGAFTGAHIQRPGRIELAQGGSLFLDEVAELPLSLQVKLLRFLQDFKVERVGGRETIDVDVRIIAATNRDIKKLIAEKKFREDLYYRLAVVTIELPPLRERGEDILILGKTFLQRFSNDKKGVKSFSYDAVNAMNAYPWPGNVREMENKIRRAMALSEGDMITPADIGLEEYKEKAQSDDLKKTKEKVEVKFITEAIVKYKGNLSKASEELGMTRQTLYHLIKKYNIPRFEKSDSQDNDND